MRRPTKREQIQMILYAVMGVSGFLFFGLALLLRNVINFPIAIPVMLVIPVMGATGSLAQILLEKSRYKAEIDAMEKEAEEEEKKEAEKEEKPQIWSLAWLSFAAVVWAMVEGATTVDNMVRAKSFVMFIPEFLSFMTLLIIGLLLAKISWNVRKGRVFTKSNYTIIYWIALTVVMSVVIQQHYWDATPMIPNSTVGMYFLVFGMIIFFLGSLFRIAIKIKNDQDLTI